MKEKNLEQLRKRLEDVGLSLDIYKRLPPKYVRINPHFHVTKEELEKETGKLEKLNNLDIYRSSGVIHTGKLYDKGIYHIQDLSSVLPVLLLDLKKGDSVLDLCSAPGLKTCLIHDLAKTEITCVEKNRKRFNRMLKYFTLYGIRVKARCEDGVKFKGEYDKVLVDAPCSGEGIVSKYDSILEESNHRVKRRSVTQKRLLQNGFNLLKPGGIIVYYTCTLNKYENDVVIQKFLKKSSNAKLDNKIPDIELKLKKSEFGFRIIPGLSRGGFVSRIRKIKEKK
ncbi:MAG: hypothetical protein ABIJ92_05425 [Candidatus Aenigmatarchaeota archaeon]